LTLLNQSFTIHRLSSSADVPAAALISPFFALTRTDDELSIVLPETIEIESNKSDSGWACFKVEGPLEFNQVGILAGISTALANAGVSIFALSTFDTDYILVKREQVQAASDALTSAGYIIERE
jgi:hypothetical protein